MSPKNQDSLKIEVTRRLKTGESLSSACESLGVDEATLNRWTAKPGPIAKARLAEAEASMASFAGQMQSLFAIPPKPVAAQPQVKLPARLRKFYEAKEYQRYQGWFTCDLPGWVPGNYLALSFCRIGADLFDERLTHPEQAAGYFPLAEIENETDFLAVDLKAKGCPVLLWNHEVGQFERYKPSLDAFLKALVKKKPKNSR